MFSCSMHTAAHRLSVYLPTRIVTSRKGRILKHKTVSAETQSSSSNLKSSRLRQFCQYVTLYWSLQAAVRYEIRAVLWIYSSKTFLFPAQIIRHRTHSNHTYIIHTSVLTHSRFLVPFLFIRVCLHTTNVLQGKAIAATPVLLHVFSSDGNKMLYGNKAVSFSRCLSTLISLSSIAAPLLLWLHFACCLFVLFQRWPALRISLGMLWSNRGSW